MVINNPILFWTAFGAIGTTAGAIATAIAVIVALWQVKHAEKKSNVTGLSLRMALRNIRLSLGNSYKT